MASGWIRNEQEYQCWYKGQPIARNEVSQVQSSQLLGSVSTEKSKIDIDSHAECPIAINRQKHLHQKGLELA